MFKLLNEKDMIRELGNQQKGSVSQTFEDIDEVANTSAATLEDSMSMAETVGFLLMEVSQLKDKVNKLEGGK